jgi:hypothetical protein
VRRTCYCPLGRARVMMRTIGQPEDGVTFNMCSAVATRAKAAEKWRPITQSDSAPLDRRKVS